MGDSILDDQRLNPFRMRERKAKADRAAIVLHEENVAMQIESHRELIHDGRQMVESVREGSRVRRPAMTEAGIVRRDQMVAVGKQRH